MTEQNPETMLSTDVAASVTKKAARTPCDSYKGAKYLAASRRRSGSNGDSYAAFDIASTTWYAT